MLNPLLSAEQQGIVVFWIRKELPYWKRLLLSFGCLLVGAFLQYYWYSFWVGFPFLVAGNLFLLVRGYDNRVELGKYSPQDAWEKIEWEKLSEVEYFIRKIKRWDRSTLDISNNLGVFTFMILLLVIVGLYMTYSADGNRACGILAFDLAILFIPHWFTGRRQILSQPKLLLKIKLIKKLLQHRDIEARLDKHELEFFILLGGKEVKVPDDVKFRVAIQNQHSDFLGFYGQIVTNSVKNKTYPYFYVVLVAKKGYGLRRAFTSYSPSRKIKKEYKKQDDVEVLVIRQTTTRTSGYYTKDKTIRRIFLEGLSVAEDAAVKE